MQTDNHTINARCKCGENRMVVTGQPIMRAICHCRFCQEYTGREHSDFVIYRRGQVTLPSPEKARFRAFKQPAFVNRGSCIACGGGAYEHVKLPLFPKMVIIPVPNHETIAHLPAPALHMFYHRRQADAHDEVPKYVNLLNSEFQFVVRLVKHLKTHSA